MTELRDNHRPTAEHQYITVARPCGCTEELLCWRTYKGWRFVSTWTWADAELDVCGVCGAITPMGSP